MKPTIRFFAVVFASALLSLTAFAWNGTGHETIAAIAYRNLDPGVRAKVDTILQEHPKYDTWKAAAERASNDEATIALYVFMQAATWPDDIRRSGNPYDHPNWHFVDYPYTPPNKSRNPASPHPGDDVLFGMSKSVEELSNGGNSDEVRAAYVSWIIHMVGDSHQPLHCACIINDEFPAPNGDRGGNLVFIRPETKGIKLHSFWDGLLGNSKLASAFEDVANRATKIEHDHPQNSFPQSEVTASVHKWALESYGLAIHFAYLDGKLDLAMTAKEAAPLPDGYTKNAGDAAERQAALAGYRLAHVLNQALAE